MTKFRIVKSNDINEQFPWHVLKDNDPLPFAIYDTKKLAEMCVQSQLEINEAVNHPKHYTSHPSGVECIQVTEHMNFNKGNAVKYIWRAGDKGNEIQDLEKAAWYIQREIARLKGMK